MNRIYSTALAVAITAGGAMAQQAHTAVSKALSPSSKSMIRRSHPQPINASMTNRDVIWSNDFSNPSDWVIAHDGPENLDWQIGVGLEGQGTSTIDPIASTTASNGYAMIDSDVFGNTGQTYEQSHLTMAQGVDLTDWPQVVVEFETQYLKWQTEECYLVVSYDDTWPVLDAEGITNIPGVYRVWPDMGTQDDVTNPTLKRINISSFAGGHTNVKIRFHWVGIFGYQWYVDDVRLATPPPHDMVLGNTWLVPQPLIYDDPTIRNLEYTNIPLAEQIPLSVRAAVFNNGGTEQTNVTVTATVNGTPYSGTPIASLAPSQSDTVIINTGWTASAPGPVTVDFAVAADSNAFDDNAQDNLGTRNYTVTGPGEADGYSVMNQDEGALSTYFTICGDCAQDAMATRFQIQGTGNMAYGIGVGLYDGATSVSATMNLYLRDDNGDAVTIEFFEILPSYTLSAGGEGNFLNIGFEEPVELDPSMDYEVWVENQNGDTIAIGSSGKVNPGGLLDHAPLATQNTIYVGTGNPALMLRLYLDAASFVGINEPKENGLAIGISAPNPADVMTRIPFTLDNATEVNYQVMDINGKLVAQKNLGNLGSGQHTIELDVQDLASGAYNFSLTAGAAHLSRTVVVAH